MSWHVTHARRLLIDVYRRTAMRTVYARQLLSNVKKSWLMRAVHDQHRLSDMHWPRLKRADHEQCLLSLARISCPSAQAFAYASYHFPTLMLPSQCAHAMRHACSPWLMLPVVVDVVFPICIGYKTC